jgi:hypothetical protein
MPAGASRLQVAMMRRAPSPAPSEARRRIPSHCIPTRTLTPGDAVKALWPRPERIALAPATPAERASVVALARALRAQPPAALAQEDAGKAWAEQAEAAGFALEVWRVGADDPRDPCEPGDSADAPAGAGWFWVLRERGDLRGHGTYLFRAGPDQEARHHGAAIILQAPHAYFERGTGALALAVLLAAADDGRPPDVLMTDSLHRYQQASGARSK